jgi:hypothetical protein
MSDTPRDDDNLPDPTDPFGRPPQPPSPPPSEPPAAESPAERPDAWWPSDPDTVESPPPSPLPPAYPVQPGSAPTAPSYPPPGYGPPPAYGQPDPNQPGFAWPAPGAQAWQAPPVPPQGWGYPPAAPKNEGLAVGALVCGIIGALCGLAGVCGVVIAPVGIGLGISARRRIARSNGALKGEGMALAGIILGAIGTVVSIVWIIVLIANPDILQELQDSLTTTTTGG